MPRRDGRAQFSLQQLPTSFSIFYPIDRRHVTSRSLLYDRREAMVQLAISLANVWWVIFIDLIAKLKFTRY